MVRINSGPTATGSGHIIDLERNVRLCQGLTTRLQEVLAFEDKQDSPIEEEADRGALTIDDSPAMDQTVGSVTAEVRKHGEQSAEALAAEALSLSQFRTVGRYVLGLNLVGWRLAVAERIEPFKDNEDDPGADLSWVRLYRTLDQAIQGNNAVETAAHAYRERYRPDLQAAVAQQGDVEKEIDKTNEHIGRIAKFSENKRWVLSHIKENTTDVETAVKNLLAYKRGEQKRLLSARERVEHVARGLQVRLDLMELIMDVASLSNILITKYLQQEARKVAEDAREAFTLLVSQSSPPDLDGIVAFSDSSVERQERVRVQVLGELREIMASARAEFDPLLGSIASISALSCDFRHVPFDTQTVENLNQILTTANSLLA